eukprot:gb/GEZN01013559.1/.p1 GENE.gb/GEZN01013559.1/~~gb/GEZN01013559.1/.p1  ORF type:complete len:201 (+),score=21.27 gb/GEZN01013559.1/:91-603(+)
MMGDVAMQHLQTDHLGQIDPNRSMRLCAFRVVQAPVVAAAWRTFDGWVKWTGARGVVAKIFLDQSLLAPISMSLFFLSQSMMEGRSFQAGVDRVETSLPSTMCHCVPYWTVIHSVTFNPLMPPHFRIAWSSTAAVGWNMYLSYANASARKEEVGWTESRESDSDAESILV